MKSWTRFGATAVAVAGVSVTFAVFAGACSSSTKPTQDSGTTGVACTASPGVVANPPNCDPSSATCGTTSACAIDEATCGSKSTCLPMGANDGKTIQDFRIRRLNVAAPPALAQTFIQKTVIDQGISLAAKQCGEQGDGSFSWLIRVDKTAKTVTTGGAPPTPKPFDTGYCFVNGLVKDGNTIAPTTKNITFNGEAFTSEVVDKLYIPIFVQNDPNNLIVLPITKAQFKDVTISANGNCIGSLNPNAMPHTDCLDSRDDCSKWNTAGSMAGYITLEEADAIQISLLGKSLCTILVGDSSLQQTPADGGPPGCKRDASGKIVAKGDFCSTSNKPGDCQDSYWLTATFAAAAVKITDGAGVKYCSSTGPVDAGTD